MNLLALRRLIAAILLLISTLACTPYIGSAQAEVTVREARQKKASPKDAAKARAIADQVLKAYGGYAKLKELDELAFKSIGKIEQFSTISSAANTFDSETLSKGEKMRSKIDLMGQPLVTGYDGTRCWIQQGEQIFPADPTTTNRIVEEIKHGLVLLLKLGEPGSRIDLGETIDINGRPATGLRLYAEDGKPTTFYIDDETHLVVRSEYAGTDLEQGVSAIKRFDYSDNRPVFGSIMPYKVLEYSNSKKSSETTIISIEPSNANDDVFSMPTEKPIARLKQGPVVIPFEYVSNEIIINATVNNSVSLRFLVDTGATQSILDQSAASGIGEAKASNFAITTGAGHMQMGYMNLECLQLGDITLANIPVAVTNLTSFSHLIGNRPHGLLGANVLKRFAVTIDYDKRQLILHDPTAVTVPEGAQVVKTKPALGVSGLAVDGLIDGKVKATCLVDTGAAFNNISEGVVKSILPTTLLPVGEVLGLDGRKIKTSSVRFKTLELDNLTIDNPIFSVAPSSTKVPAGLFSGGTQLAVLGNPIWSKFRTTIDYRGQRLILEASQQKQAQQAILKKLIDVQNAFRQDQNYIRAISQYRDLATNAERSGQAGLQALSLAYAAMVESEQTAQGKKSSEIDTIDKQFDQADRIAQNAGEKEIEAKVLAIWCMFRLDRAKTPDDLASARRLLGRATKLSSTEPLVGAAASRILFSMKQPELAEKLLDQTLALDPSNWSALHEKYKMSHQSGQSETAKAVALQLKYYYPASNALKSLPLP